MTQYEKPLQTKGQPILFADLSKIAHSQTVHESFENIVRRERH